MVALQSPFPRSSVAVRERHEAGIGFTYNIPAIPNSPVFLDPSHLAAWFAGYFRAQSDEIDAAEALKKALSDEIGAVEERKKALSLISEEGN